MATVGVLHSVSLASPRWAQQQRVQQLVQPISTSTVAAPGRGGRWQPVLSPASTSTSVATPRAVSSNCPSATSSSRWLPVERPSQDDTPLPGSSPAPSPPVPIGYASLLVSSSLVAADDAISSSIATQDTLGSVSLPFAAPFAAKVCPSSQTSTPHVSRNGSRSLSTPPASLTRVDRQAAPTKASFVARTSLDAGCGSPPAPLATPRATGKPPLPTQPASAAPFLSVGFLSPRAQSPRAQTPITQAPTSNASADSFSHKTPSAPSRSQVRPPGSSHVGRTTASNAEQPSGSVGASSAAPCSAATPAAPLRTPRNPVILETPLLESRLTTPVLLSRSAATAPGSTTPGSTQIAPASAQIAPASAQVAPASALAQPGASSGPSPRSTVPPWASGVQIWSDADLATRAAAIAEELAIANRELERVDKSLGKTTGRAKSPDYRDLVSPPVTPRDRAKPPFQTPQSPVSGTTLNGYPAVGGCIKATVTPQQIAAKFLESPRINGIRMESPRPNFGRCAVRSDSPYVSARLAVETVPAPLQSPRAGVLVQPSNAILASPRPLFVSASPVIGAGPPDKAEGAPKAGIVHENGAGEEEGEDDSSIFVPPNLERVQLRDASVRYTQPRQQWQGRVRMTVGKGAGPLKQTALRSATRSIAPVPSPGGCTADDVGGNPEPPAMSAPSVSSAGDAPARPT